MSNQVTFKGKPLNLEGDLIKVGDAAPNFLAVDGNLHPVSLNDFEGKIKVITTFPSIDTPVCDAQVREFNKRATGLSDKVAIIGISKDLPFAQSRFCGAHGITGVKVLSDYKHADFSLKYGLHIKELALTARSVIIIDVSNYVRYVELVKEVTSAPDYDAAFAQIEQLV